MPHNYQRSQPFFVLLLVVAILVTLVVMMEPFLGILLAAWVVYHMCGSTYHRWSAKFPHLSSTARAAFATFLVFLFILTPVVLLGWTVAKQTRDVGPVIREWNSSLQALEEGELTTQTRWVKPARTKVAQFLGMKSRDVQSWLSDNVKTWMGKIDVFFAHAAGNVFSVFVGLCLFLLILFFLFRDGKQYAAHVRDLLPLEPRYQELLIDKTNASVQIILRGLWFSALLQGVTALVGYMIIGLPGAILLGCLSVLTSLIPYIGSSLVWAPAVLVLAMQGHYGKAVFLFLWGGIVVSLIDNLAAPYMMNRKSHMPFPFLLLAIFGGLSLFGVKGLLLGPLILLLTPTLMDIYRKSVLGDSPSGRIPELERRRTLPDVRAVS